ISGTDPSRPTRGPAPKKERRTLLTSEAVATDVSVSTNSSSWKTRLAVNEAFVKAAVFALTSPTRTPKLICIKRGTKSYPIPKSACQWLSLSFAEVLLMPRVLLLSEVKTPIGGLQHC